PTAQEILARLSGTPATLPRPAPVDGGAPFLGRQEQLNALRRSLEDTRRGQPILVFVHGQSGAGKTPPVQRFPEDPRQEGTAVVLSGRCYERESVPYKALDGLIDALSRYWHRLDRSRAEALLPRDADALARLFPVLSRLEVVAAAPV